jgi:hypothetical protein
LFKNHKVIIKTILRWLPRVFALCYTIKYPENSCFFSLGMAIRFFFGGGGANTTKKFEQNFNQGKKYLAQENYRGKKSCKAPWF